MFKLTPNSRYTYVLITIILLFPSCSEEASEPTDGIDGTNGFNALVDVQSEASGSNCSAGGVRISVGQDSNENGQLDESEILSVSFICNGIDGSDGESSAMLVSRTLPENPGENCENGGTLIEIGTDLNNNSSLDDSEVQTSFYVCNGTDGQNGNNSGNNGLTSLIKVSVSSSCSNGGIVIDIGLDSNENSSLESEEISGSYEICDGQDGIDGLSTLSNVTTEAPGLNCANGGIKVELGLDNNSNGILDTDEVVSENYVCNGDDGDSGINGSDGISSLTRVSGEESGDNCDNGGLLIEIGMDDVITDGVLQNDEVDYTYYVCNGLDGSDGNDGLNSLIRTTNEDAGDNCDNGGIRIDIGLDTNNNNTLDVDEFIGSPVYVCNGLNGTNGSDGRDLILVTDTDVSCPNGGVELTFGYDDNDDGTIDEVVETALICNGVSGNEGADGSNGTNGLNSIVRTSSENPGTNCPNGGRLVEVGIDDNRNNNLDAGEVDSFFYICNGEDGNDGASGNNSLITVSSFSGSQGGCTNGGLIIRTGVDDDGNGILSAPEVDATSYLCDGDDGADGNSDGIFEFYFQEGFDAYTGVLDVSITDKNPAETGQTFSVDRGISDSHALIQFPQLETLTDLVGQEFTMVEAILYLRGVSGRVDGQTQGNWIGVKTLTPEAPLFEEDAVTWTRANSADESWAIGGVTSQIEDGNANGYSDMFQLPPTANFAFDGYIPLQLSLTEVTAWTDKDTGKDSNKGLVLLMANPGIAYELDIFSSNYSKDSNFRPLLYLKVKTGVKGRSAISEEEYKQTWQDKSYEEKLVPLLKRMK